MTIFAVGKGITYSECASVTLVIQHVKRVRHILMSPVACPALPHFPTLSHKRYDFSGRNLLNTKCGF